MAGLIPFIKVTQVANITITTPYYLKALPTIVELGGNQKAFRDLVEKRVADKKIFVLKWHNWGVCTSPGKYFFIIFRGRWLSRALLLLGRKNLDDRSGSKILCGVRLLSGREISPTAFLR